MTLFNKMNELKLLSGRNSFEISNSREKNHLSNFKIFKLQLGITIRVKDILPTFFVCVIEFLVDIRYVRCNRTKP